MEDIESLVKIWKDLGPGVQPKLKLVIEKKIQNMRACAAPEYSSERSYSGWNDPPRLRVRKYDLLESLTELGRTLPLNGFNTDVIEETILEEVESMMTSHGIGTPSTTELGEPHSEQQSQITSFPVAYAYSICDGRQVPETKGARKILTLAKDRNGGTCFTLKDRDPTGSELSIHFDARDIMSVHYGAQSPKVHLKLLINRNKWNSEQREVYMVMCRAESANSFVNQLNDLDDSVRFGRGIIGTSSAVMDTLFNNDLWLSMGIDTEADGTGSCESQPF